MRIQTTAPDRKTLVKALAAHLGQEAVYSGPPSFAYTIGSVTVDREGEIILPDEMDTAGIKAFLVSKGWLEPDADQMTISVPAEGLTVKTMNNLLLLLYNKQYLLGKAIKDETIQIADVVVERLQQSTPETPADFIALVNSFGTQGQLTGVDFTDDRVSLSFPLSDREDVIQAFTFLTVGIIAAAKAATRIQTKHQQPENEKYYMRSWLIQIGFGGKECKGARDILLKHLKGHSAFRSDLEAQKHRDKYGEIRRIQKESAVRGFSMKKAEMKSRLLDLKERQDAGEKMLCPRCGRNTLKTPQAHNALSRYADLYVCDECGMTEAMLDMMRNPLPLEQWAVFKNAGPQLDFKALSMQEVAGRVLGSQTDELLQLHHAWVHRAEGQAFDAIRTQALKACPGMVDLWENPFCAVYLARDGQVMVRLRWGGNKSEIAVDTLPNSKK